MSGTKSDRGKTRVDVDEAVVMVGHAELASILCGVAVAVANERTLPLNLH